MDECFVFGGQVSKTQTTDASKADWWAPENLQKYRPKRLFGSSNKPGGFAPKVSNVESVCKNCKCDAPNADWTSEGVQQKPLKTLFEVSSKPAHLSPKDCNGESACKHSKCGATEDDFPYSALASRYIGTAIPHPSKEEIEPKMFEELHEAFNDRRDAYFQLHALVDRFEAQIIEKWLAMTENKRFEILFKADSGMPEIRRYDLDIYFDPKFHSKMDKDKEALYSRHFVWPMLNGALKTGTNFLRLLKSRGRIRPNGHLLQDIGRLELAERFRCLPYELFKPRLPGWAVRLDEPRIDKAMPVKFGEIDGIVPKFNCLPQGMLSADIARYGYLCQTHILKTLTRSCMFILGKSESDADAVFSLMATQNPSDVEPVIPNAPSNSNKRKDILDNPWSELENELLYDAPRPVDLQALLSRVRARSEEAADAFLAAREEPAAFQTAVNDGFNCCLFRIPQLSPNSKASLFKWKEWEQWNTAYQIAFQQVTYPAAIWSTVSNAFGAFLATKLDLAKAVDKYFVSEYAANKLESLHTASMKDLISAVAHSQDILTAFIHETLPGSQGFRKDHRIFSTGESNYSIVQHGDAWQKDPFLGCISHLSPGSYLVPALLAGSWEETMDRMQPLLQIPKNKERLTDSLVFAFDDMLLLTEIKRSLKTHQPEYFRLKHFECMGSLPSTPKVPQKIDSSHLKQLERTVEKFFRPDINTAKLNHSKDAYSDKASRNNRERLARAEDELAKTWFDFEDAFTEVVDLESSNPDHERLEPLPIPWEFWIPQSQVREFGLHAGATEAGEAVAVPLPASPAAVKGDAETPEADEKSSHFDSPFGSSQDDAKAERPKITPLKDKVKTRPAGVPGFETHSPERVFASSSGPSESSEEEQDRTIHLTQGALKTALSLFGHESGIPGELPWVDMARLMSEMGFEGVKNGGSAWQFKPVSEEAVRIFQGIDAHISMHEPHPEKNLARRQISGIVRRLRRRLNLQEEMFKLAQRDATNAPAAPKAQAAQKKGGKKDKGKRK